MSIGSGPYCGAEVPLIFRTVDLLRSVLEEFRLVSVVYSRNLFDCPYKLNDGSTRYSGDKKIGSPRPHPRLVLTRSQVLPPRQHSSPYPAAHRTPRHPEHPPARHRSSRSGSTRTFNRELRLGGLTRCARRSRSTSWRWWLRAGQQRDRRRHEARRPGLRADHRGGDAPGCDVRRVASANMWTA
jgi:hypothetical protein